MKPFFYLVLFCILYFLYGTCLKGSMYPLHRPRSMHYSPPGFEPFPPRLAELYEPEFMNFQQRRFWPRPHMEYYSDDMDSRDDSPYESSDEESYLSYRPRDRRPGYILPGRGRRPAHYPYVTFICLPILRPFPLYLFNLPPIALHARPLTQISAYTNCSPETIT